MVCVPILLLTGFQFVRTLPLATLSCIRTGCCTSAMDPPWNHLTVLDLILLLYCGLYLRLLFSCRVQTHPTLSNPPNSSLCVTYPVRLPIHILSPPILTLSLIPPNPHTVNLATLAALTYSTLYIALEPVAGLASTPLLLGAAALANKVTAKHGSKATKLSVLVHAVSWIAQFVGHGKFEGRAPALLVSPNLL